MKKINYLFVLAGFALMGVSCGGGGGDEYPIPPTPPVINPDNPDSPDNPDDPPAPPEYPTFAKPNWTVSDYSIYENSMTAYLALPDSLKADQLATDEVAVFCSSECRGVAERIEVSQGDYVWVAYVHGNDEDCALTVKYYSVQTRHMYQSEITFSYEKDGHYANIDAPQILGLKICTE